MTNRILWVEDEALKLEGLVRPLKKEGCEIDYAFSEYEAETKIKSGINYDIIIVDLIIPSGVDGDLGDRKLIGVDLITKIKVDLRIPTPILVVSIVNDTDVIRGLDKFIEFYLPKRALRPSKLKEEVDRIIKHNLE